MDPSPLFCIEYDSLLESPPTVDHLDEWLISAPYTHPLNPKYSMILRFTNL